MVAVPDAEPWARAGDRTLATVNRRVDILEDERSRNRISEAAYRSGRIAQAVFERLARRPGGSNWQGGDRVDASMAADHAVARHILDAREALAYLGWLERQLGMIDARLIARVLRDRMSYAAVAAMVGKSGGRGVSYMATRFRDALEALAEAQAAAGRELRRERAAQAAAEKGDPPAP